jgi:hypothetical protein
MPRNVDPGGTSPRMSEAEWVELKQRIDARLELVINLPRRPLAEEMERSYPPNPDL